MGCVFEYFHDTGIKTGQVVGGTDEMVFSPTGEKIEVFDVQATVLHLLGLDHVKLTYRYQGRDFRLRDVAVASSNRCLQPHRSQQAGHRKSVARFDSFARGALCEPFLLWQRSVADQPVGPEVHDINL